MSGVGPYQHRPPRHDAQDLQVVRRPVERGSGARRVAEFVVGEAVDPRRPLAEARVRTALVETLPNRWPPGFPRHSPSHSRSGQRPAIVAPRTSVDWMVIGWLRPDLPPWSLIGMGRGGTGSSADIAASRRDEGSEFVTSQGRHGLHAVGRSSSSTGRGAARIGAQSLA